MPGTRARPVIGFPAYAVRAAWGVWDVETTLLPQAYVDAVVRAGGLPVVLPAVPGVIGQILDRVDGVLIAGGPDVEPARYGAVPGPATQPPSRVRDAAEAELITGAVERGLPLLGICRGMQVLNVVRGGTLVQHLPDVVGTDLHSPAPGRYGMHEVKVEPGSVLARVLGGPTGSLDERIPVPSYHHQGVQTLGTGLVAVAWADDGVVEAVEDPRLPFCLGVQWHPEIGDDPALFDGLVAAARERTGGQDNGAGPVMELAP
jgi:putative glutamine amidotransferase